MDEKDQEHRHDEDVIDKDLYESFTDEEMLELVEQAKIDVREKERQRAAAPPRSKVPGIVFWLIVLFLVFNLFAIIPQTFSTPAFEFIKTSAQLSTQSEIKAYKDAVVLIETSDSKGTGFFYDDDGNILTNDHVVEGTKEVSVFVRGEGRFYGQVVENYPDVDLAVVHVETDLSLPHLELADQFDLKAEEKIYFIGNPLRFAWIVNEGTILEYINVSGKSKPVVMMDAPVYRGNSGSPVINMDGQVIGVVYATVESDASKTMGLFIPIDYFYQAR